MVAHVRFSCFHNLYLTDVFCIGLVIDSGRFLSRIDTPWKIGAHVSSAGGVENAIVNASSIGYSYGLFYCRVL